jgi:hypothetical protein
VFLVVQHRPQRRLKGQLHLQARPKLHCDARESVVRLMPLGEHGLSVGGTKDYAAASI